MIHFSILTEEIIFFFLIFSFSFASSGDSVCAFYRVTNEGEFRRLPTLSPASAEESYLCHAWLPEDRVVVGTASGNLVLLETGNFAGKTRVESRVE